MIAYIDDNGIARTYTIIAHCIVNEDKGKLAIWKICRIQRNTELYIVLEALHEPIVLQKHTEKENILKRVDNKYLGYTML